MSNGKRLYDPEWWRITLDRGIPLSFRFSELPFEELKVLDNVSKEYPGYRWNLLKQRGLYILTILPSKHLEKNRDEVKGEP